jgi:hypothetical protein
MTSQLIDIWSLEQECHQSKDSYLVTKRASKTPPWYLKVVIFKLQIQLFQAILLKLLEGVSQYTLGCFRS